MKTITIVAILLIALGLVAFAYQGITYKTRDTKIDFGPIKVVTEKTRTIPLPPIVGALALVCGTALLVVNRKTLKHATSS